MAKIIDKIIVSPTPPQTTNAAWFDGNSIKMYTQGKWESATSEDIQEVTNSLYSFDCNKDFNDDFSI